MLGVASVKKNNDAQFRRRVDYGVDKRPVVEAVVVVHSVHFQSAKSLFLNAQFQFIDGALAAVGLNAAEPE